MTASDLDRELDGPRFTAAVELVGRTGAEQFQIRFCEEEEPVVWFALANYGERGWQVAAAMHPVQAVFRLCDQLVDGGTCTHCGKPTGFEVDLDDMPLPDMVCWYQFDPERATFRRGCE